MSDEADLEGVSASSDPPTFTDSDSPNSFDDFDSYDESDSNDTIIAEPTDLLNKPSQSCVRHREPTEERDKEILQYLPYHAEI
ncbi:hypothetical protein PT974_07143 [Cladobotryum mycophilum]|uniref:Uncharacterized protein n=1 Tax=Cladobotryum mycophilum TaxID=491253 RepID=A0ABR0SP95_9HYPO